MAVTSTSGNIANYNVRFASLSALACDEQRRVRSALGEPFHKPTFNEHLAYLLRDEFFRLLDYSISPGSTMYLALTFVWTTSTAYQITNRELNGCHRFNRGDFSSIAFRYTFTRDGYRRYRSRSSFREKYLADEHAAFNC